MKKNFILIQLEGINQTLLWQYQKELASLWRFLSTSVRHTRFFTTSTTSDATWRDTERFGDTLSGMGYKVADPNAGVASGLAWMKECPQPTYARYRIGAGNRENTPSATIAEKIRRLFADTDATFATLLATCSKLNLLENTVLAVFGDGAQTGRDFPSAARTHAPLFLFDPSNASSGTTDRLACTLDIASTALGLHAASGLDLTREQRDFVFSRNDNDDRAVSDGTYRLTVERDGATALYCDQTDPANSCDLLRFFSPDREQTAIRFAPSPDAVAKHFLHTFSPPQTTGIASAYAALHAALKRFTEEKRHG